MPVIKATFDGRVFVPRGPVDAAAGTEVEVVVSLLPRAPTPQQDRDWQEIAAEIASTDPFFSTVEEALRQTRRRP